ncbi:MAG: Maleate cis-trans isomerase [Chloroflexi bacterium]|jgi:maleate cis-trans isomerase|nr:MAG: Maleate cis-trans isomerase [Chloroflexota bacterium]
MACSEEVAFPSRREDDVATGKVNVGFLSPISLDAPHFDRFERFVPDGVSLGLRALDLVEGALTSLQGKEDVAAERAIQVIRDNPDWQSAAILGAPVQVYNPGMAQKVRAQVSIPITTALEASAAALKALGASRILLMTPFDETLNAQCRDFLAGYGIQAASGPQPAAYYRDAEKLGSDDIYRLTAEGMASAGDVQAVYFQGAIFDPLPIIGKLEADMKVPIVASNPAMLWHLVALVGGRFSVPNGGKLLEEWPSLAT